MMFKVPSLYVLALILSFVSTNSVAHRELLQTSGRCGNGIRESDEVCDDGNTIDGDWCNSRCSSGPVCGNLILEGGEECDSRDSSCVGCKLAGCGRVLANEPPQPQSCLGLSAAQIAQLGIVPRTRRYSVRAIQTPIVYNKWGNFDPQGMMFLLETRQNLAAYRAWDDFYDDYLDNYDECFGTEDILSPPPTTCVQSDKCDCRKWLGRPLEWQQPLVLRASLCDTIEVSFKNRIKDRLVGLHLAGDGAVNARSDGTRVGNLSSSVVEEEESRVYTWRCNHQGSFLISDGANFGGTEVDTHVHGLFGALICEPPGSWWSDPHNISINSINSDLGGMIHADIHPPSYGNAQLGLDDCRFRGNLKAPFPSNKKYALEDDLRPDQTRKSYREFVTFYHDQTSVKVDPFNPFISVVDGRTRKFVQDSCVGDEHVLTPEDGTGSGSDGNGTRWEEVAPFMLEMAQAIDYRAEPLPIRAMFHTKLIKDGFLSYDDPRMGSDEETHHMSWLYGDPGVYWALYQGDPFKVHVIHAAVKETHIHHLHLYSWHQNPYNKNSMLIDAEVISPMTTFETIPLYGGGSRQMAVGDVIFHCHLYPHFMEGMWSFNRIFDRRQDGNNFYPETYLEDNFISLNPLVNKRISQRRVPIDRLEPLPDRIPPPLWSDEAEIRAHLLGSSTGLGYNAMKGCLSQNCRNVDQQKWIAQNEFVDNFFRLPNWQSLSGFPNFIINNRLDDAFPHQRGFFPYKSPNAAWPEHVLHGGISQFARAFPAPAQTTQSRPGHPWGSRLDNPHWNTPINSSNFYQHYNYHPATVAELAHMNRQPEAGFFYPKFPTDQLQANAKSGQCPECNNQCCGCPGGSLQRRQVIAQSTTLRYNRYGDHDRHGMIYLALEGCENGNCRHPPSDRVILQNPRLKRDTDEFDGLSLDQLNSSFPNVWSRLSSSPSNSQTRAALRARLVQDRGVYRDPLSLHFAHNDMIELHLENWLEYLPRTKFDEALPKCARYRTAYQGEVGTHVHLVKFDSLSADGAATGYNYVTGASFWYRDPTDMNKPGNVRFNRRVIFRWWADEELGHTFFHDHPFANLRQKHGTFGSSVIHPCNSIVEHPLIPGVPQIQGTFLNVLKNPIPLPNCPRCNGWEPHRAVMMYAGDWNPVWDIFGDPIQPPDYPSGSQDPGTMTFNLRNDPLPFRGQNRPRDFFTTTIDDLNHREPATPLFHAFVGDRVWLYLIQGSHEESHAFQLHGWRWPMWFEDPNSQRKASAHTGISQKWDLKPKDGPEPCFEAGDYLYKSAPIDDQWAGMWGLFRVYNNPANAPITTLPNNPRPPATCGKPSLPVRRYEVVAESRNLVYNRNPRRATNVDINGRPYNYISDPFAVVYRVISMTHPDGQRVEFPSRVTLPKRFNINSHAPRSESSSNSNPDRSAPVWATPFVITARKGETVQVSLTNNVDWSLQGGRPEPFAPDVARDIYPEFRVVDDHVSLHPLMLEIDPSRPGDGCNVGANSAQTVAPGQTRTYIWRVPSDLEEGSILLHDCADVRNHKHHGAIGALRVIGPRDDVSSQTLVGGPDLGWIDFHATVSTPNRQTTYDDVALLVQDSLRLFFDGDVRRPLPDVGDDLEDAGYKGYNFGCEPTSSSRDEPPYGVDGTDELPEEDLLWPRRHKPEWLSNPLPATPRLEFQTGTNVTFSVISAMDRSRSPGFALHGHTFYGYEDNLPMPRKASVAGVIGGTHHYLRTQIRSGDWAYRAGAVRHQLAQGQWGYFRGKGGSKSESD